MAEALRWPRERGLRRLGRSATLILLVALGGRRAGFGLVASGALPAPSAILVRLLGRPGRLSGARLGDAAGLDARLSHRQCGRRRWPAIALRAVAAAAARLARGINIAIFALPPIAIAPILVLTLEGIAPRVVLAALGVYFVTMTRHGDRAHPVSTPAPSTSCAPMAAAAGRCCGWCSCAARCRRSSSGFRVAAPNAVLGAILAEFGGGGRWGLGAYLLGSLGRADPARLWGIGLVATLIAGASLRALRGDRGADASARRGRCR